MASTHMAYLKMKMPAPRGPLTVVGNYRISLETASAGSNLAESLVIAEEKRRMQTAVALAQSSQLTLAAMSASLSAPAFKPTKETKDIVLDPAFPERTVRIGAGLKREEEGKTVQRPVYYLSEVLSLSKQNYPHFQKMTYGVFMAATKLKHYFEEHPMKVVSEAPISDIMCNKDASGRIAKWAIQISPYVPVYERRDAIKSQALADFLVDWAEMQYKPPDHRILEDAL
ncbi:hypothetical protein QYE76_063540 [Lolium multiflorum]|uniref:Reverse transcriptase RNase H-like domain-containing protein n=1 Tax=Lolium multiflorum TaxID=4521 RepID=A0AAD8S783_LOLMU|nr:hypothetical protein QYE76_063540 [Lolium multiflorum]